MPRRLSPTVMLTITFDAICSRNRYTKDPAPVIAELLATAGGRTELLTEAVGTWVGFFEDDYTQILCAALRELPGLEPWIAVGAERRARPDHRTPTAHMSASWPERVLHAPENAEEPPPGPEAGWGFVQSREGV